MYGLYVTHPQVVMDPAVAVPRWELSELGRQRAERFAAHPLLAPVRRIVSSDEPKAFQLAATFAAAIGGAVESSEPYGEARRTGFLDRDHFEQTLDSFYAEPDRSVDGWETARNAQSRIAGAVEVALDGHDLCRPIVFTGHGTVGTLLKCRFGERPISRDEDQRRMADPGGGNVFVFRLTDRLLLTDWLAMEALPVEIAGL